MTTSPLVGRHAELAAVERRVAATRSGAGGALLVLGEAGVGKPRAAQPVLETVG